jgi:hypothetical protein
VKGRREEELGSAEGVNGVNEGEIRHSLCADEAGNGGDGGELPYPFPPIRSSAAKPTALHNPLNPTSNPVLT